MWTGTTFFDVESVELFTDSRKEGHFFTKCCSDSKKKLRWRTSKIVNNRFHEKLVIIAEASQRQIFTSPTSSNSSADSSKAEEECPRTKRWQVNPPLLCKLHHVWPEIGEEMRTEPVKICRSLFSGRLPAFFFPHHHTSLLATLFWPAHQLFQLCVEAAMPRASIM